MILSFIIIGFLAWSFVSGFQAARKIPGRIWYGALVPGVIVIAAVQAAESGNLADRMAPVVAGALLILLMAGLGAGIGWFFRPKE